MTLRVLGTRSSDCCPATNLSNHSLSRRRCLYGRQCRRLSPQRPRQRTRLGRRTADLPPMTNRCFQHGTSLFTLHLLKKYPISKFMLPIGQLLSYVVARLTPELIGAMVINYCGLLRQTHVSRLSVFTGRLFSQSVLFVTTLLMARQ